MVDSSLGSSPKNDDNNAMSDIVDGSLGSSIIIMMQITYLMVPWANQ